MMMMNDSTIDIYHMTGDNGSNRLETLWIYDLFLKSCLRIGVRRIDTTDAAADS